MDPVFFKLSQVLLFLASVWTTRSCNYSGRPPYKLDLGSKLMIESECSQAVENTVLWFFIPIVNKNPQLPAQNYTSVGSEGILIVNEVTKLNNGTYYFSALENGVRSESAKIPVIIACKYPLKFNCNVSIFPDATQVGKIKRKFRFSLSENLNLLDHFGQFLRGILKFLHRPTANDLNYTLSKSQFLI